MRGNGGLIGPFPWPQNNIKTGVFGLQDNYNQRLGPYSTWPDSPGSVVDDLAKWSMRYHMYGNTMGDVYVYWEVGSSYTLLWSQTSPTHTSYSDEWDFADSGTVLSTKAGETGKIVFVYIRPSGTSWRGDAAFCEMKLTLSDGTETNIASSSGAWKTHYSSYHSNGSSVSAARVLSTPNWLSTSGSTTWKYDTGGGTPSSSTGPDRHYDNSSYTDYIHFEASGSSSSIQEGYCMRTDSSFTL